MKKIDYIPTEIDKAQLASFIDGEGCIDIHLSNPKKNKRPTPNIYLRITVVNTDPRLPLWCMRKFGGSVSCRNRVEPRNLFAWTVGSKRAVEVIAMCLPYFVIKREQAEVAIAFSQTIGRHGKPVSDETIGERLALRDQLKEMKATVGQIQ